MQPIATRLAIATRPSSIILNLNETDFLFSSNRHHYYMHSREELSFNIQRVFHFEVLWELAKCQFVARCQESVRQLIVNTFINSWSILLKVKIY